MAPKKPVVTSNYSTRASRNVLETTTPSWCNGKKKHFLTKAGKNSGICGKCAQDASKRIQKECDGIYYKLVSSVIPPTNSKVTLTFKELSKICLTY